MFGAGIEAATVGAGADAVADCAAVASPGDSS